MVASLPLVLSEVEGHTNFHYDAFRKLLRPNASDAMATGLLRARCRAFPVAAAANLGKMGDVTRVRRLSSTDERDPRMANPKYLTMNGQIVRFAEAKVHVLSPCVKYGAAVFEGIRGYWNSARKDMY